MPHQKDTAPDLESFSDQLFFGLLSNNPDSAIEGFIKKYVPVLHKRPETGRNWTIYPPDYFEEPAFQVVANSFVFFKHPCLNMPFKSGILEITQKTYPDEKWMDSIQDIRLWLNFDGPEDAKHLYGNLVDMLSRFNTVKKFRSNAGIEKAEFTDRDAGKYPGNIQFTLAKDNFTENGYKILFET